MQAVVVSSNFSSLKLLHDQRVTARTTIRVHLPTVRACLGRVRDAFVRGVTLRIGHGRPGSRIQLLQEQIKIRVGRAGEFACDRTGLEAE
jgi:hypothetical protein